MVYVAIPVDTMTINLRFEGKGHKFGSCRAHQHSALSRNQPAKILSDRRRANVPRGNGCERPAICRDEIL